jgi:signal transduction histidine kinase
MQSMPVFKKPEIKFLGKMIVWAFLHCCLWLGTAFTAYAQKKAEYKVELTDEDGIIIAAQGTVIFNRREIANVSKGRGLVLMPRNAQWIFDVKVNLQSDGDVVYQAIYKGWTLDKDAGKISVKLQKVKPVTFTINYPDGQPCGNATIVFKGPKNNDTLQIKASQNGLIKHTIPYQADLVGDKNYSFFVDGLPANAVSERNGIVRIIAARAKVNEQKQPIAEKHPTDETRLMLLHYATKQALSNRRFVIGGQSVTTDAQGVVTVKISNELDIEDYNIENQLVDDNNYIVKVFVKPVVKPVDISNDALTLEAQLESFIRMLGERNNIMDQEIEKIKLRINADRSFTKEQRERLSRQIQILQNITDQNDAAYKKAHVEIKNILKQIGNRPSTDTLMEKELSLANEKLRKAEEDKERMLQEQEASKEASRLQLLAALSVAGVLFLVVLIFFIVNKSINRKQEELALRMEEINRQNDKIRSQNELLMMQQEEIARKNLRLEELNNEKNSLMDIVAHDLKSPLSKVVNIAQLLPVVGELNEEQRNYVTIIRKSALDGTRFIDDLLDINAIEQGQTIEISHEKMSLAIFLPELLKSFRHQADMKSIRLHFQNKADDAMISTDREYLKRIMENLVSNAIKFSPHGSNIYLKVKEVNMQLYISVKDEGPGIGEEDHKRLFKKFQRLSARPTGGESSTGLGLSIVKLLTERLGGRIMVNSVEGKGSEFIVVLPKDPTLSPKMLEVESEMMLKQS